MIKQFLVLALCVLLQPAIASAKNADQIDPAVDPAVSHANAIRNGPIAYKEGYFGKGDNRLHYVILV
jgi:hypothetical protein